MIYLFYDRYILRYSILATYIYRQIGILIIIIMITLIQLHELCKDKQQTLQQLIQWGLLPKEKTCPKCGNAMNCSTNNYIEDGVHWICSNRVSIRKQKERICQTRIALREGTFFQGSHLSLFQVCIIY